MSNLGSGIGAGIGSAGAPPPSTGYGAQGVNGLGLGQIGSFMGYGGHDPSIAAFGQNQDANKVNQGAVAQGQQLYGQQAPTIDQSGGAAYNPAIQGGISNAMTAAGQAQQTALGKGPQIAAANQAIQAAGNANLGQGLNASMALANSGRGGGPGLAAAQGAAQTQVGQQSTANAANVASSTANADANMMAQANQQYGQLALGAGGLAAQGQQQQYQLAGAQGQLQAGQNSLNQQGLLGSEGMGQAAELAQLQANSNALANQYGLAGTTAATTGQTAGAGIGAAAAGIAALAA